MTIRAAALLAVLALAACQGSDPQPLVRIQSYSFDCGEIAGGGGSEYLACLSRYYGENDLHILRHRAAAPDELELLGTLTLASPPGNSKFFVSGDVAAVCPGATCSLVELATTGFPTTTVVLPATPSALAIDGRWLVAAAGNGITLLDRETGSTTTFGAGAPVTSVLATQGSFLAFTGTGYVHVTPDPTAPSFAETEDATIRDFRAAYPDGAEAIVAGPSEAAGWTREVRLDLSSPAAPAIVRAGEVRAEYAWFAWDGGATSVAGAVDVGNGDPQHASSSQGYVLHENDAGFASAGIPLFASSVAMHADRLFAHDFRGFAMYRIDR